MNIGTLGAAAILMNNNNTRMLAGRGGGGSEPEPEQPVSNWVLAKWLLGLGVVLVAGWLFHLKPGFWYVEVEQRIVAKQTLQEEGNKGETYDACYIQIETGYVEQDYHWVKKDSLLWIECPQHDYLNYKTGNIIKHQIVKPRLQGWSTAMSWIMTTLTLVWIFILSALFANNMQ